MKIVFILFIFVSQAFSQTPKLPIGMNLPGNNYYTTALIFNDAMKTASNWISFNAFGESDWNTNLIDQLNFDENGYPTVIPHPVNGEPDQAVRFLINNHYTGTFVVLFDGEGELTFNGGSSYTENGRIYIELTGVGGHRWFHITRSQRGDHVRNIRIIPVEYENNESALPTFYEPFLDGLRPFHALRFMDWINTNNSTQEFWENRVTPSFYTQGGSHGISIDYAIELANLLEQDAWFCVPHRADDNFIREYANLVKNNLNPNLKIYIEYSNEIWNWQFSQSQFVNENAPGHANSYVSEDLAAIRSDPGDHPEKGAYMKARIFRLWREEFGESAFNQRVLRVAAGQAGWFDTFRRIVRYLFDELDEGADVFSPTAYFNFTRSHHESWLEMNPEDVTADMIIDSVASRWPQYEEDKIRLGDLASQYGLDLAVYEGGQHMQPFLQGEFDYNQAVWDAQIHPRMYDLYMENFRIMTLPEVDCKLFVAFSYVSARESRWGSWGHLETLNQIYEPNLMEIAPKYQALLDANITFETSVKKENRTTEFSEKLKVYPNPVIAGETVTVYIDESELENVVISLIGLNGKAIQREFKPIFDSKVSLEILSHLTSGVYLITVENSALGFLKTWVTITDRK